ncbi:hypothetical protein GIB67_011320 [Kingdonia uniflora]|uniref:Uncharacterized protein n=1 Tax=Kingdonia uniflora TaxID=39325 RepID=A0A7J7MNK2_9MAGN|nr:hypothetical protein GIB67_011320 [Kingdonia uniflora]
MSEGTLRKDVESGQQNTLINEESCYDGKVVLSKRYKTSDMESGKDAPVLESRTVHIRVKCQPYEREKINSSSSSPNNRFTIKDLDNTQRERQKIRGINQKFFEDDKRLKRVKGSGSRRSSVRGICVGQNNPVEFVLKMGRSYVNEVLTSGKMNESDSEGEGGLEQYPSFPGHLVSYPLGSDAFREFCRTWNDNIIWVKGVNSTVERKKSLLDEVAEEEIELKLVLGELGLSRKKRVESRSKKVAKAQSTSSAQPNLTTSKIAHKFPKRQIKKALPASGITVSGEVAQGKRRRVEPLGGSGEKVAEGRSISVDDLKEVVERARLAILQGKEDTSQMGIWLDIEERESDLKKLQVGAKANLDEMVEERDKLGRHLMLKGYSQEEVNAIKADTYVEEEEEEAEVLGVLDGLDGVSPQMVLDNQRDDIELPEGGSEKVVREMSLRINDLESGLARE